MLSKGIAAAASTDPGQRPYNEDCYLLDAEAGLYVVADGVGGRQAGEVASKLACDTIARSSKAGASLQEAIQAAHAAVRAEVDARPDSGRSGMASTVVALQLTDEDFRLAWAGDSRAYLWNGSALKGLTRDHSLVEQLIARNELAREEARNHPQKNVILSGVGGDNDGIQIACNEGSRCAGGLFLLCSDGLSDVVSYKTICNILKSEGSLAERAKALTDTARESGGRDNITALLVECSAFDATHENVEKLPEVYEIYDASSDTLSWPNDQRANVPTIQRVRSRATELDNDPVTRFPIALVPASDDSSQTKNTHSPRIIGALVIGAIVLAALFFLLSDAGLSL